MRWLREARRGSEPKDDFHPLSHCERILLAKEETMEPQETIGETVEARAIEARETSSAAPPTRAAVRPAQGAAPCPTCSAGAASAMAGASYVYVLGQIEERYPRPSVEKEVAQATGRAETAGRTDRQAFHQILSQTRKPLSLAAIVLGAERPGH